MYVDFKNKSGGVITTLAMVDATHGHALNISGSTLSMTNLINNGNNSVSLNHSHTGKATFNNDGTVTITIDSSFNYATSSTIKSDSVTATAWYKARAYQSTNVSIGGYSGKAYVVTVTVKAIDGHSLYSGAHRVDASAAYDDGYGDGWDDGYDSGEDAGYWDGWSDGYNEGKKSSSSKN